MKTLTEVNALAAEPVQIPLGRYMNAVSRDAAQLLIQPDLIERVRWNSCIVCTAAVNWIVCILSIRLSTAICTFLRMRRSGRKCLRAGHVSLPSTLMSVLSISRFRGPAGSIDGMLTDSVF
jgi:hypothetical protein